MNIKHWLWMWDEKDIWERQESSGMEHRFKYSKGKITPTSMHGMI